jgi:hypothetical protein
MKKISRAVYFVLLALIPKLAYAQGDIFVSGATDDGDIHDVHSRAFSWGNIFVSGSIYDGRSYTSGIFRVIGNALELFYEFPDFYTHIEIGPKGDIYAPAGTRLIKIDPKDGSSTILKFDLEDFNPNALGSSIHIDSQEKEALILLPSSFRPTSPSDPYLAWVVRVDLTTGDVSFAVPFSQQALRSMAVDRHGVIFFTGWERSKPAVLKWIPGSSPWSIPTLVADLSDDLSDIGAIAIDNNGKLLVGGTLKVSSNGNIGILRVDPNTGAYTTIFKALTDDYNFTVPQTIILKTDHDLLFNTFDRIFYMNMLTGYYTVIFQMPFATSSSVSLYRLAENLPVMGNSVHCFSLIGRNRCIQSRMDPHLGCVMDDGKRFSPTFWHGYIILPLNTCYAYAVNKATTKIGKIPQPGGGPISPSEFTCDGITKRAEDDGLIFLDEGLPDNLLCVKRCRNGGRRIALVVNRGDDAHWYREQDDGIWSHKPGHLAPRDYDGSGFLIRNVADANTDDVFFDWGSASQSIETGRHYKLCGCFCTQPTCNERIR